MERAELRRRILHGAWIGALATAACLLIALALLWPRCQGGACPSVQALETYRPPQASEVLDRDGRLVARLAPEQRIFVPINAIPPRVTGAFVAGRRARCGASCGSWCSPARSSRSCPRTASSSCT